jgi:signal transduction histidine kinase
VLRKLAVTAVSERHAGPAELQLRPAAGVTIDVQCWVAATGTGTPGSSVSISGQVLEITDAREHERRLGGAERMEVIGRLAGGIAHDFNNLLMVVSGNSERLLDDLPESSPLRPAATAIRDAAARAAALTRQLLAYGRRQVFALEPLALQAAVQQAAPLLADVVGDAVRLEIDVEPDAPAVSADSSQIRHVLAALARNAREAMPAGGTLRVSVDTTDVDDSGDRDRPWVRPGRYVRLIVSDTGHGMDPVTRAHVFQPFFTTKPMGDGRGLGLASVYGIVKQSRGFIWVESEPELGARFTLLFPVLHDLGIEGGTRAPETVLLVDGDRASLAAAAEALGRRGYRVLEASSPTEAIDQLASYPDRVHLLLADAAAVTADGVPLSARLKAIDPMMQSLAIVNGRVAQAGLGVLPTTPTIQKPFSLYALAARVRAVLDSGEGR